MPSKDSAAMILRGGGPHPLPPAHRNIRGPSERRYRAPVGRRGCLELLRRFHARLASQI